KKDRGPMISARRDDILGDSGVIYYSRSTNGEENADVIGNRVSARPRAENNAVNLCRGRDGNVGEIRNSKSRAISRAIGYGVRRAVRRGVPVAGCRTRIPGRASGVRIKDEERSKN